MHGGLEKVALRDWGVVAGLALLVGVTSLGAETTSEEKASPVSAKCTLSLGSDLDPEKPNTAFELDPELSVPLDSNRSLGLLGQIVRPTDPYENFSVPKIVLEATEAFRAFEGVDTAAYFDAIALRVDSWKLEGHSTKFSAGVTAELTPAEFLTISTKLGPTFYVSEFQQTTDGNDLPRYGLYERLSIGLQRGRTHLDFHVVVEQKNMPYGWKNDFSTRESLYYELSDHLSFGLEHALISSVVDESTGNFRGLNVFDNRKSNIAAFVQATL